MAKTKTVPIDPLMGLDTAETLVQYIDILLEGMNAGGDYVGERWFIESMVNEDIVDAMKRYGIAVAEDGEIEMGIENSVCQIRSNPR